jgi:hypothetical protein
MSKNIGAGFSVNTQPGSGTVGSVTAMTVTGSDLADGDQIVWSSALGGTFDPNPSTAGSGSSATNYTAPGTPGTDTLTAEDASQGGTTATGTFTVTAAAQPAQPVTPPAQPSQPVQPATPSQPPATTSGGSKVWYWIAGIVIAGGVVALLYWAFGTEHGQQTFAGEKKKKKKRKKSKKK